jgi:hypothetical protein
LEKVAHLNVPHCALSAKGCQACGKQAYLEQRQILFVRKQDADMEMEEDSSGPMRAARAASAKATAEQSKPHGKNSKQPPAVVFQGTGGYTLIENDLYDIITHNYLNDNVAELLLQRLRAAYPKLLGLDTLTYLGNAFTAQYAGWYGDKLHLRHLVVHLHHENVHYTLSCAYDGKVYWFDTTNQNMGIATCLAIKQLYSSPLEPQLQVVRVKMVQQSEVECLCACIVGAVMLAEGSTPADVACHERAELSDQYAFVRPCIEGTKRIQDWPRASESSRPKKVAKGSNKVVIEKVPPKLTGRVWGRGVQRQWEGTIGWKDKA